MKTIYYAVVYGKLPRKKKEDRFEVRMEGETPFEAINKLKELIVTHKIRNPHGAYFQGWNCRESNFTDDKGIIQTMVFRDIFPCGSRIAVDLE